MDCRLFFVLWSAVSVLHVPATRGREIEGRGRGRRGPVRMVAHAVHCPRLAVPSDFTCDQHLRHVHETTSYIVNYVIPGLIEDIFRPVMRLEAYFPEMDREPVSPVDIISVFNNLTSSVLRLQSAENLIGLTHHGYSNSLCDPLTSLGAAMADQIPSHVTGELVLEDCHGDDWALALLHASIALRTLQYVHDHVNDALERNTWCNYSQ